MNLRIADRIRDTESSYWEALFLLIILAYVLLLVYTAWGYSGDPRLFPLLIGVPLVGIIVLRVVMLLSTRFNVSSGGALQSVTTELEDAGEDDSGPVNDIVRYRRQIETIGWLCGLTACTWALGFQIGLIIFVFTFVYTYERDTVRAAGAALITYAIIYTLFIRLLSVILNEPALLPDSIAELLPAVLFATTALSGVTGW
jgi:hypothetical protein